MPISAAVWVPAASPAAWPIACATLGCKSRRKRGQRGRGSSSACAHRDHRLRDAGWDGLERGIPWRDGGRAQRSGHSSGGGRGGSATRSTREPDYRRGASCSCDCGSGDWGAVDAAWKATDTQRRARSAPSRVAEVGRRAGDVDAVLEEATAQHGVHRDVADVHRKGSGHASCSGNGSSARRRGSGNRPKGSRVDARLQSTRCRVSQQQARKNPRWQTNVLTRRAAAAPAAPARAFAWSAAA